MPDLAIICKNREVSKTHFLNLALLRLPVGQSRQRSPCGEQLCCRPSGTGRELLPEVRMQEFRQTQKAINPRNIRAYRIKHIWLLRAGFGLQRWRGSRTNTQRPMAEMEL